MPQLGYTQTAIQAQPGMLLDGDLQSNRIVDRIVSAVVPFGSLCEMDSNGYGRPVQDATTLSGTVTVTNASADITFSTTQTLPAGQPLVFSDQPGVLYYLAAEVAASTDGVLTVAYSGTGGAGKLASVPFNPNLLGIAIYDPLGEEQNYQPWQVPVTLGGTVTVTNGSASITFSMAQTLAAGSILVFSDQPGVEYILLNAVAASTAATLTSAYQGTGGAGKTTQVLGGGSTCPGYKIGRAVSFLRRGGIWLLGDGAGTAQRYGKIQVNHSSTTGAQGVFTFSSPLQTVGSEVDVAPGVCVYNPDLVGGTTGLVANDPFGNNFRAYPAEVDFVAGLGAANLT